MSEERGQQELHQNQVHEPNFESRHEMQDDKSRLGSETLNERRKGTANRGFAAMDPERQKKIASEGGRAAHK